MKHARRVAGVLVLMLAGGLVVAQETKDATQGKATAAEKTTAAQQTTAKKKPTAKKKKVRSPQHRLGTIHPSGPSECTVSPEHIPASKSAGDDVYWILAPGASGSFEVKFDKGDGSPCVGTGPWVATGRGPSAFCAIDPNATVGKSYRYSVVRDGTVCADPGVDVQP